MNIKEMNGTAVLENGTVVSFSIDAEGVTRWGGTVTELGSIVDPTEAAFAAGEWVQDV